MRALVTGGAGFIGSTLVDRLLAEGHTVDVVDDLSEGSLANLSEARAEGGRRLTFHQLDVRHPELVALVQRRQPEVVYHLAARRRGSLAEAMEVAVTGAVRVLEAARAAGAGKLVVASTADVYARATPRQLPIRESHRQQPRTPAAVAARAVVDLLVLWRERHELEYTALALTEVYGPRQPPTGGPVAAGLSALRTGAAPTVGGDGRQTRDFLYVDDAVDALARAATKGDGLLLNIGTGVETSLLELCRVLAATAGVPPVAPVAGPPWEGPARLAVDPAQAEAHLGWAPWTALADGAAATLAWWRQRSDPA